MELLEPFKKSASSKKYLLPLYSPPKTDGSGNPRQNLRVAKKILEEEGWFIQDGKLMRDGKHFEFEFLIVSPSVERIALAFQKTLEVLGITMNVRTVDSSQYQARLLNYDFDMIKASWNVSIESR